MIIGTKRRLLTPRLSPMSKRFQGRDSSRLSSSFVPREVGT